MKLVFVLIGESWRSREGISFTLWAYHDTDIVLEVATFRSMPYRNIVESCALVYERGFRMGIEVCDSEELREVNIETEIFFNEESAGDFVGRIKDLVADGGVDE